MVTRATIITAIMSAMAIIITVITAAIMIAISTTAVTATNPCPK